MRIVPAISPVIVFAAAGFLVAKPASAQEGSSVIVQRDDGGTRVIQFTMPDLAALRTPDFTRRDLPIFDQRLVLSAAQSESIGRQIDAYLEAFIELTRRLSETAGADAQYAPPDADEAGAPRDRGGIRIGGPAGGGPRVDFSDLEQKLPPGSSIGISVGVTAPGPGQPGSDDVNEAVEGEAAVPMGPQASVEVSIDSPEGEISQELLAQFQQRADEMAAQIIEDVKARQAIDEANPGDGAPRGRAGVAAVGTPDDIAAQQALVHAAVEEFLKARANLRATFVQEAQTSLAEDQIARWPSLERALTRERSLPKGRFAGESTDLLKILEGQKLSEAQHDSLSAAVENYELALDAALKARDAFIADVNQKIDAAIAEQKPDRALQLADRASDLRAAVRNINQKHARGIAQALGADEGKAFHTAALEAFYPNVHQRTRAQRMFDELLKAESLDQESRSAIEELHRAYEAELATMNEQIRQTIDREQPRESRRRLEGLKRTMQGEDIAREGFPGEEGDPIRNAMEKRGDLDDRYLRNAAQIVPPAIAGTLPRPRTHKGPVIVQSGAG